MYIYAYKKNTYMELASETENHIDKMMAKTFLCFLKMKKKVDLEDELFIKPMKNSYYFKKCHLI